MESAAAGKYKVMADAPAEASEAPRMDPELRDKIVSAMIKVSLLELERQGQLSRRKRRRMRRQHAQRRLAADRD